MSSDSKQAEEGNAHHEGPPIASANGPAGDIQSMIEDAG